MEAVATGVDALPAAQRHRRGATRFAPTVHTRLLTHAGRVTTTAVRAVAPRIDARPPTREERRRTVTHAEPFHTRLPLRTRTIAPPTVPGVALRVDAIGATQFEPIRAPDGALALHTRLPLPTRTATITTMFSVHRRVYAPISTLDPPILANRPVITNVHHHDDVARQTIRRNIGADVARCIAVRIGAVGVGAHIHANALQIARIVGTPPHRRVQEKHHHPRDPLHLTGPTTRQTPAHAAHEDPCPLRMTRSRTVALVAGE